jgi:HD superfamily phosphohydrolase
VRHNAGEDSAILSAYQSVIEQFTDDLLAGYTAKLLAREPKKVAAKEFNDPVWGTIKLGAVETIVLDSPLLQRLRRIRQLGVAHLVYSGANHTRIEHSIGVCHQISRMFSSAVSHAREAGHDLPTAIEPWENTLRMAALCHDVGHGLLSHVSENALALNRTTIRLRVAFKRQFKKAALPQLSEMAAYYMVASPAFAGMLMAAYRTNVESYDAARPMQMARMIAGLQADNNLPLLHEMVSGPFDADKLDYMTRDAVMCGVPIVTDINRLVQKVRAVSTSLSNLPARVKQNVEVSNDSFVIFGVARSGARAIDEVALGRSLMFDKIYRHHKVRAIEAMASSIINETSSLLAPSPEMIPLMISDETFFNLTLEQLLDRAAIDSVDISDRDVEAAAELARRLRDRELSVRCFAFAQKMPFDNLSDSDERRLNNSEFTKSVSTLRGREEFLRELTACIEKIAAAVGRSGDLRALPGKSITPYIHVDPPSSDSGNQDSSESYAYLVDDTNALIEVAKAQADTRGWVDAYVNTRDIGYIFGPRPIADLIHVASEIVMRHLHAVRVPPQMSSYSKMESKAVQKLKNELQAAGFYDNEYRYMRPDPPFFSRGDIPDRLTRVVAQFSEYAGPAAIDGVRDEDAPKFDSSSVLEWVKQFPDQMVEHAFRAVENTRLLVRHDVSRAISGFLDQATSIRSAVIAPLGDPKDGSHVVAYHAGDASRSHDVQVLDINAALLSGKDIILVDDFVGIGGSSISIIDSLLGLASKTDLKENRPTELSEKAKALFTSTPLHFVFITGLETGRAALESRIAELQLNADVFILDPESSIPQVSTIGESSSATLAEFDAECRRIGYALMKDEDHAVDVAHDRELGYGNMGKLLITAYNTPTVTLTALWAGGEVEGQPWAPLFPRRPKR